MSQVLLQLVVTVRRGVCFSSEFNLAPNLFFTRNQLVWVILYDVHKSLRERDFFSRVSTVARNRCSYKLNWVINVNMAFCFPGNCISFTFSGHAR